MALPSTADLAPTDALTELSLYLRPPGAGVYSVSTGREEIESETVAYLGGTTKPWREHLAALLDLRGRDRVALLAIPSDGGAGIVRGAAWGPQAIRRVFGSAPTFDLGDVFTVPHFIDDEMLSADQRASSQDALYADLPEAERRPLPVSPLTMAERALRLIHHLRPDVRVLILGGDHTVTTAPIRTLLSPDPADNQDCAIVHFDAHTDLLPERLGVRNCFATWAYHANVRLGGGERLLQLGIRASGQGRSQWESRLGVRQVWAEEARSMSPEQLADVVIEHLGRLGTRRLYLSNDIDGTDSYWASACGTPEPGGLEPDQVETVIRRLSEMERVEVLGADIVEVAPGLSLNPEASERTVATAARYARASLELLAADRDRN